MTLSRRLAHRLTAAALAAAATFAGPATAQPIGPGGPLIAAPNDDFVSVVGNVASMIGDEHLSQMVAAKQLNLVNVMWEDTGRWEGSAVGPNISDVTIEVEAAPGQTFLMPVIRNSNFSDKTADVRMDRIFVPVGNHKGGKLKTISLTKLLADPGRYLSKADAGKIKGGSLLAKRDGHALVSAQHAFLPVPKNGKVNFWPVIFNYQSYQDNPAVLTILVTRQGTSMTIVDNARDTTTGGSWGQRLYFNEDGEKAPLLAERLKDVQAKGTTANGERADTLGEDANLLMLIQVPLKQKDPPRRGLAMAGGYAEMAAPSAASGGDGDGAARSSASRRERDIDTAVLGHGETTGPFTELDGKTIERDARFPVRVTVQFYQATATGGVDASDIDRMAAQIDRVYAKGDYVGSLVVPGPRDRMRPTNWSGDGNAHFMGLFERWTNVGGPPTPLKTK
ncbi:MAG: hypothetical protein IPL61_07430 [Myxococcales bacterium]|nr:hypothetical protein [Myxococcales bacterium]